MSAHVFCTDGDSCAEKHPPELMKKYDLSSLKALVSGG
jgi:hypothetical protein